MNASFIDLLFPHGIHKTRSFQTIVQIEKKVNFFYTNISIICASCSKTRVTSNTIEIFLNKPCFFLSVLQLLRFKVLPTCICINQNIPFNKNNKRTPLSVVQMVKAQPGKTQIRSKLHGLSEFLS